MCSYYFVFLVKMIGQGRVRVLTRIEGRTPALPVEVQVLEDDWLKHYCTKHHSQHSKKRVKLTTACHRKEKEKKESYLDKFFSQQLCWRTLVPAIYADNIGVQNLAMEAQSCNYVKLLFWHPFNIRLCSCVNDDSRLYVYTEQHSSRRW